MSIKHVRRAVVTAAPVTALVLAGATSASADGNATWRHKMSDDCLFYRVNGAAGLPYDTASTGVPPRRSGTSSTTVTTTPG
ncbi:hypothetical protein ACFWBX_06810 [Streptomyces sp. NPDC059991]|uniref:hypothetical protein n=1 Tax=Streptomyces sp. NPDC059991 TaxID=3347028 RepID=UPI0036A8499A